MNKFYDLYMQEKVSIKDLDDFWEEWHRSNSQEEINVFLGLTQEQYYLWCDDPALLEKELDFEKHKSREKDDPLPGSACRHQQK